MSTFCTFLALAAHVRLPAICTRLRAAPPPLMRSRRHSTDAIVHALSNLAAQHDASPLALEVLHGRLAALTAEAAGALALDTTPTEIERMLVKDLRSRLSALGLG
eukprot:6399518-Prymnesium_polylepis.1